jgi:plasmid stabilization system protein ParE
MAYSIIVSPRAQKEIENAIDFYVIHSEDAPKRFLKMLVSSYKSLSMNPFYAIQYKNVRSLKISKFPFSLYFTVDEQEKLVRILACFHNKRNPKQQPRK